MSFSQGNIIFVNNSKSSGGTLTGADNGLSLNGTIVELGGTLIQDTTINMNNSYIEFTGTGTESFYVDTIRDVQFQYSGGFSVVGGSFSLNGTNHNEVLTGNFVLQSQNNAEIATDKNGATTISHLGTGTDVQIFSVGKNSVSGSVDLTVPLQNKIAFGDSNTGGSERVLFQILNDGGNGSMQFIAFATGTTYLDVTKDGVITAAPPSGNARWKLGLNKTAATTFDTNHYVEIQINNVTYKLALVI